MRILILSPSGRLLGARQSLVDLATHLPNGVEVLVVSPNRGEMWGRLNAAGVPVEVVPHHPWRKVAGWIGAQLVQMPRLRELARRFRPDLIHANEFHSCPQATRVSRTLGCPATGHVRLTITPRQIRNYGLGSCSRIVCVSAAVSHLFAGSGLESRTRVVHNGIDVSRFRAVPDARVPLAETALWPETALVVGLLGLVSERKNQLLAAEAVSLAIQKGADVRLLLAGDAFKSSLGYGEDLKARLARPDLHGRAVWVPFREDVAGLYGACDLNMLISSEEGFGRTIVEAGAAGRPSIGSARGGIPELIEEGASGWIVRELTPSAVAQVLVEAYRNRAEVLRRGAAARSRVESMFSIEACVRGTLEVWREAIQP